MTVLACLYPAGEGGSASDKLGCRASVQTELVDNEYLGPNHVMACLLEFPVSYVHRRIFRLVVLVKAIRQIY